MTRTYRIDVTHMQRLLASGETAIDRIQSNYAEMEGHVIELVERIRPEPMPLRRRIREGWRVMRSGYPAVPVETEHVRTMVGQCLMSIAVLRGSLVGLGMALAGGMPIPDDATTAEVERQ